MKIINYARNVEWIYVDRIIRKRNQCDMHIIIGRFPRTRQRHGNRMYIFARAVGTRPGTNYPPTWKSTNRERNTHTHTHTHKSSPTHTTHVKSRNYVCDCTHALISGLATFQRFIALSRYSASAGFVTCVHF